MWLKAQTKVEPAFGNEPRHNAKWMFSVAAKVRVPLIHPRLLLNSTVETVLEEQEGRGLSSSPNLLGIAR